MTNKTLGVAVTKKMVAAAQASYEDKSSPEYGLNDEDMTKAIRAALGALTPRAIRALKEIGQ